MATVTLTWQIEGIHDGIGVYRSNQLNTGFELIATLAPNTTIFEDDFLLSQLTDKYGTEPEHLFYRLDAFRGLDVKSGDVVPVPLEDTMPEFLAGKTSGDEIPELRDGSGPKYYLLSDTNKLQYQGKNYTVLVGVHNTLEKFITDVSDNTFLSVNQYLRNLNQEAKSLSEAIQFTTEIRKQTNLGSNGDATFPCMVPFLGRTTPVMEVLPTYELLQFIEGGLDGIATNAGLVGQPYIWTSTIETSDLNEFGQAVDIDVTRFQLRSSAGSDQSSILSGSTAYTFTLLLIEDI